MRESTAGLNEGEGEGGDRGARRGPEQMWGGGRNEGEGKQTQKTERENNGGERRGVSGQMRLVYPAFL